MNPVVVIPTHKNSFSKNENACLLQCRKVLGNYDIVFAIPYSLDASPLKKIIPSSMIERFDDNYFKSLQGYNRLKYSVCFYNRFHSYEHLLTYEPDAFVFTDQLPYWCSKKFDFVGAPLSNSILGVQIMNSGLSLRRVDKALAVLNSYRRLYDFSDLYREVSSSDPNLIRVAKGIIKVTGLVWNTHHRLVQPILMEDVFWSLVAHKVPEFEMCPIGEAKKFSIEASRFHSSDLPDENNKQFPNPIPFGIHKFWRDKTGHWISLIRELGYDIDNTE